MAEPGLPPFPATPAGGRWDARSPRIPYVAPPDLGSVDVAPTGSSHDSVPDSLSDAGPAPARFAPEPDPLTTSRSFVLEFADGPLVTVEGAGLVGRAPVSPAGVDGTLQLVRIDDPGRSVSKTHLRFETDSGGLWIEDLRSGNGTAVASPGLPLIVLVPGQRRLVEPGSVVRLGQRSFTVR